jgi:hypothetical protein
MVLARRFFFRVWIFRFVTIYRQGCENVSIMVWVFCGGRWVVARVVVTKGGGVGGGAWRMSHGMSFGNLLVQRNRITLEISLFSQKYSV